MACGNWLGGEMATMPELRPEVTGLRPMRDSSSRRVSFSLFLKAFRACLSSSCVGDGLGSVIVASAVDFRRTITAESAEGRRESQDSPLLPLRLSALSAVKIKKVA